MFVVHLITVTYIGQFDLALAPVLCFGVCVCVCVYMCAFLCLCTQQSWFKLNPIPPGLFEGGAAWGGGGQKVPTAYNSKTIDDTEMKLGGVVKNH